MMMELLFLAGFLAIVVGAFLWVHRRLEDLKDPADAIAEGNDEDGNEDA